MLGAEVVSTESCRDLAAGLATHFSIDWQGEKVIIGMISRSRTQESD